MAKYNWEDWFERETFTIKRDKDYAVSQSAIVQQVRNRAYSRGYRVSVADLGNRITVVVTGRPPEKVAPQRSLFFCGRRGEGEGRGEGGLGNLGIDVRAEVH